MNLLDVFWTKITHSFFIGRPPIVTNVPEGYIELMKECWHFDPTKRPTATDIREKIDKMYDKEELYYDNNRTQIIESSDIGPVITNNPGAIYKSRPLSNMIQSAMFTMSTRSLRSRSITTEIPSRFISLLSKKQCIF